MPKIVDSSEKRAEFIAASLDVIANEGFAGFTMRRVSVAAGSTTGALTHYFVDRQELLIEALRAEHMSAYKRMLVAADANEDKYERLRGVILQSLPLDDERLREWRVWLAFWGAAMSESELALENSRRYEEWGGLVELFLKPLTKSFKLEAELLIALVDGLGLRIARLATGGDELVKAQSECQAAIERYLSKFES